MTREEQLDWLYRLRSEIYVYMPKEWLIPMSNALDLAIKALEQEPTTKNNLAVDCISRADALDCVNWGYSFSDIYKKINELPSVTPQEPRKGHWIWCVGSHKCSNCEEYTCFSHEKLLRYCPNCGAKMESEE